MDTFSRLDLHPVSSKRLSDGRLYRPHRQAVLQCRLIYRTGETLAHSLILDDTGRNSSTGLGYQWQIPQECWSELLPEFTSKARRFFKK